jgi:phosphoesterase RecJ-like protein
MFEQIKNVIERFNRILIHRHSRPDGDAMGSQIGLRELLRHNYPEKEILAVGDSTGFFGFMEGAVMDEVADEAYENALAIVLDCGAEHLISDTRWKTAAATARMDHHIFTGQLAEFEVIDTSFESCCGMVAALAEESGWALTPLAAKSLYTGMVTDSGRFRYDGTTARTFRLAAFLMEQPIDTNELFRQLYADDFESKKRKAQFVLKTQFSPKNVAYIYTTREEFEAMGLDTFTVSRAMVNTMADIRGVDIWVNFTETENGVLCELRSSTYNINPIAVKYGGGGHMKASGATLPDRQTALQMLDDLDQLAGENA